MNPTTVEGAVLLGVARLLGAHPALTWHEDDDAAYPADAIAVAIGELRQDGPGVGIDLYDDAPVDRSATALFLQAQIRGTADPLDRTAYAAVRDALDGQLHPAMPEPARVTSIRLSTAGRLGRIGGVWRWSANFRLLVPRASEWA